MQNDFFDAIVNAFMKQTQDFTVIGHVAGLNLGPENKKQVLNLTDQMMVVKTLVSMFYLILFCNLCLK